MSYLNIAKMATVIYDIFKHDPYISQGIYDTDIKLDITLKIRPVIAHVSLKGYVVFSICFYLNDWWDCNICKCSCMKRGAIENPTTHLDKS